MIGTNNQTTRFNKEKVNLNGDNELGVSKRSPTGQNETIGTNNQNLLGSNEERVNLDPSDDNEQSVNNDGMIDTNNQTPGFNEE